MHRCDEKLQALDKEKAAGGDVSKAIADREKLLLPMYRQVAVQYCDLHDRSGRMKGLGAIREELEWRNARAYLHWRIRRRLRESQVVKDLLAQVPEMASTQATAIVTELTAGAAGAAEAEEDQAVAEWLERNT